MILYLLADGADAQLELVANTSRDTVRDLHTETKLMLGGGISHNWRLQIFPYGS